ncbi:unnamed protein product [Clonostachys chloroleuca]|uniref:Peptidase M48 domain-containing protein n=1 Tax=Clonostachys chloroleuca TaxID=1926264 RepID=A0AA35VN59_9HYPO|nr:unnamed protein product [Clonostachys chloroleuca]
MLAPRLLRQRCLARPAKAAILLLPPLPCATVARSARPRFYSPTQRRRNIDPSELQRRLQEARPLLSHKAADRFQNAGRSRNSKLFVVGCVGAAVAFYLANSQTVPVTGRRRFNFLGEGFLDILGSANADAIAKEIEEEGGRFLPPRDRRVRVVQEVMEQLIPVSGMKDREWVVHVIDDERTANAFVTPGNRLFVYSGLIRVCGNRDALAAVMGHEIAHAVAAHSAERMSAACVANLTSGSLFFLIGALPGLVLFGLWSLSGGRFIQNYLFSLPMTRKMESEADYIGLMMMAEAGFDPRAAIGYWERMQSLARRGGQEVPELLSTHPSNENRIEKMKEWMPEALQRRSESPYRTGQSRASELREVLIGRQLFRL